MYLCTNYLYDACISVYRGNDYPRSPRQSNIRPRRSNQKVNDSSFKVKSQSGSGFYKVKATPTGMTCDCPDFVYHGRKCKHIAAPRYCLEIEKDTPQGTVTEKVHLAYTQAWNAYNETQKAEINLFDELLKDLVKAIPEPEQSMGRPRLPLHETLFCVIQKVYSQLSSRRAHGLFQNATERGQIEHTPDFNVPSKLFKNPEMTPILHELITLSALPVAGLENDFSVDSTGFRTTCFSAYNGMKHGQKKEHQWAKAYLYTGVKTNIVAAVAITDSDSGDSPLTRYLLIWLTPRD